MWGHVDAAALQARLSRNLCVRVPAANLIGALLAFAAGALAAAGIKGQRGVGVVDVTVFAAYFCVIAPLVWWFMRSRTRRAVAWLRAGRDPQRSDQRAALLLPWQIALFGLGGWVIAALIWGGMSGYHDSWRYSACVALSILLGGLTTSGIVYLLVEWTLRPLVALALAGDAPERTIGPGVRTKLLLS